MIDCRIPDNKRKRNYL